jgi:hypothetical protein
MTAIYARSLRWPGIWPSTCSCYRFPGSSCYRFPGSAGNPPPARAPSMRACGPAGTSIADDRGRRARPRSTALSITVQRALTLSRPSPAMSTAQQGTRPRAWCAPRRRRDKSAR